VKGLLGSTKKQTSKRRKRVSPPKVLPVVANTHGTGGTDQGGRVKGVLVLRRRVHDHVASKYSTRKRHLKLHDPAASGINTTVVGGEEAAIPVINEPARAASRAEVAARPLEARELAAVWATK